MRIRFAAESDRSNWNAYLDSFSYIPPVNRYGWKEILEQTYNVKALLFMALDDQDNICGVLPTYVTRDLRGKKRMYSLRFGLVANNNDVENELLLYLRHFCERNSIVSSLVTSGYHKVDIHSQGNFREIVKKSLMMELAQNEEITWKSLRDKTRNMIRKAIRGDLLSERGFHNLGSFYNIYCANMLSKGVSIHSHKFFKSISEKLKDTAELIVAKRRDEIIGGILILFHKDIAIYPFQSSLREYLEYAPNQFLVWEAMKLCLEKHIFKLDMGEATEGGNVYRFKKNIGGKPQDVYYYTTSEEKERTGISDNSGMRNTPGRFMISYTAGKLLESSPFWLKKRAKLWVRTRGRII